ncbi:hypothetical protein CTAYLR_002474 [Chrysophaeum taylorii]|uniref:CAAX prenyl protease 2/Lysostaphin resistance protein A-like domain-containing protein n=1 Tax=Chrysophaeum taylorii TaxID=2483200 RepID=A0AAD7UM43_9STRA|nr:hypothetical protein CTAYLR_002474 [Chrysophaeum taylorii]
MAPPQSIHEASVVAVCLAWADGVYGLAEAIAVCGFASSVRLQLKRVLAVPPDAWRPHLALRGCEVVAVARYAARRGAPFAAPRRKRAAIATALLVAANHLVCARFFGSPPRFQARRLVDTALAAPVLEEAVFRGVVLGAFLDRCPASPRACVLVQAALFAVFHASNWTRRQPDFVVAQVALAWVCGTAYGAEARAQASLWTPIFLHAINNAVSAVCFDDWTTVRRKPLLVLWAILLYATLAAMVRCPPPPLPPCAPSKSR